MTWLVVILVVAVIAGLLSYMGNGDKDEAISTAVGAGLGCGTIIFQIFLAIAGFCLLFWIGGFLFG